MMVETLNHIIAGKVSFQVTNGFKGTFLVDENRATCYFRALPPEMRAAFIEKLVAFTVRYDLDGMDVDIEWNLLPTIPDPCTPLVLQLKKALGMKNKQISAAQNVKGLHASVTQTALEIYGLANVIAYDKTRCCGPEYVGQNTPFLSSNMHTFRCNTNNRIASNRKKTIIFSKI